MGLQINLGLQQQLIVLIMSLPLGLHPSPLGPSSFSTRGLCPSQLGPSSFSTWTFSLYLASFKILIRCTIHRGSRTQLLTKLLSVDSTSSTMTNVVPSPKCVMPPLECPQVLTTNIFVSLGHDLNT